MLESVLSVVFSNAAGELVEHPAGYGLIRYRAGKRSEGDIAAMLTQAGALLLRRGWPNLLSDTRHIARPAHMRVAILLPLDVFARLAVGQVQVGVLLGNIQYKNFGDAAEAHAFLVG